MRSSSRRRAGSSTFPARVGRPILARSPPARSRVRATISWRSNELTVGSNNLSTEVSGTINDGAFCGCAGTGASLVKIGTGTLTLSGLNTYTGPTTVNVGSLIVNGSIAASSLLTVNPGGLVGGIGFLPETLIDGGTLSPGNSIGTINILAGLTFTPGSFYRVEVDRTTSDLTNVAGQATLAGTVQVSSPTGAYKFNSPYTILSAVGRPGRTIQHRHHRPLRHRRRQQRRQRRAADAVVEPARLRREQLEPAERGGGARPRIQCAGQQRGLRSAVPAAAGIAPERHDAALRRDRHRGRTRGARGDEPVPQADARPVRRHARRGRRRPGARLRAGAAGVQRGGERLRRLPLDPQGACARIVRAALDHLGGGLRQHEQRAWRPRDRQS